MGMKRIARLTTFLGLLAVVGSLAGASTAALQAPTGLRAFMLVAGPTSTSTFHRNPSFAWKPMSGAVKYELQLATASTFRENSILADVSNLLTPVGAPTGTLPWITGSPHSAYARVRAFFANGHVSPWSADYGFDIVPPSPPTKISAAPGLLRWSLVDGADAYEVWLLDKGQDSSVEVTRTNVLDERDDGTLTNVRWRVRALRSSIIPSANKIHATTYGPWSPIYTSPHPAPTTGPITLGSTYADTISDGSPDSPTHQLTPGFTWSGSQTLDGSTASFFRVYVFTDSQCVNPVLVGAAVPSQSYAPRVPGSDLPPNDLNGFVDTGVGTSDTGADGDSYTVSEQAPPTTFETLTLGPYKSGWNEDWNKPLVGPPTDIPDVNWPSGGYYWTVVGVTETEPGTFVDTELPQDVCAAGRVKRFGISSQPDTTGNNGVFATGLSASGRLVSAAHTPKFYGQPLVAWTPAISASIYQVQWSRHAYPFTPTGTRWTFTTSTVLPLKPGTWYYRVHGYDYDLPTGNNNPCPACQSMAWSQPTKVVIAAPKFHVVAARR
jgi:hypothetical protein